MTNEQSDIKAAFDSRAFVGGGVTAVVITTIADKLAKLGEMEQIMHVTAPTIALVLCIIVAALSTPGPAEGAKLVVKIFRWPALTLLAALSLWTTCAGSDTLAYNYDRVPEVMGVVPKEAIAGEVPYPQQWFPPPTPGHWKGE